MANAGTEYVDYNNQAVRSGAKTLAEADCGIVQNVTATATLTLPTPAAGYTILVRVGAPGITVTLSPGSGISIGGGGLTPSAAADVTLTSQPVGSLIELTGSSSTLWVISRVNGVIAND